jgi:hypothetical protein
MTTTAPREASRTVDPCQWSGPVRGWRRDLLEGERLWEAQWDIYLAERRAGEAREERASA